MALFKSLVLALALACLHPLAAAAASSSRHLPTLQHRLAAGGLGEGGAGDCWTALLQLRSCTNEIVLFFLNGESYLGQDCCRAIRVITRQCWPTMLATIGFTAEEGDILRGYCDATIAAPATPPPPPGPRPSPYGAATAPEPATAAEQQIAV